MSVPSDKTTLTVEFATKESNVHTHVKSDRGSQYIGKDVDGVSTKVEIQGRCVSTVKKHQHANRIAFGLSRWVVLVLYVLVCFLSGPAYFSWAALRGMLVDDGAYLWLCDLNQKDSAASDFFDKSKNVCTDQNTALKLLFTVGVTMHFVSSAGFGLVLDSVGPKVTGICGILLQMLGWVLLGSGSFECRSYIPGMMILCMGIDAAFFPCLSLGNLFPKYSSTVIAVLGAARSASFYVVYILEQASKHIENASFRSTGYSFAGLCLGFCLLVMLLIVPWKPFDLVASAEAVEHIGVAEIADLHKRSSQGSVGMEDAVSTASERKSVDGGTTITSGEYTPGDKLHNPVEIDLSVDTARHESFIPIASASLAVVDLGELKSPPLDVAKGGKMTQKQMLASFLNDVKSIRYIPLLILFVLTLQRVLYFGGATDDFLVGDALEVYKIMSPLSFVPCPLLGWLGDFIGILPVMVITNTAGTLMAAFSIIPGIPATPVCQYFSIIMYCVHVSFLLSQVYCYVADTFSARNMGKLIGLTCAVAGLMALVLIPMNDFSSHNGHMAMMTLILVESGIIYVLLGILWFATKARPGKVQFPVTKHSVVEEAYQD